MVKQRKEKCGDMYDVYIKIMYELEYKKHTIQELKEIKDILQKYRGQILEVKTKKIDEEETKKKGRGI